MKLTIKQVEATMTAAWGRQAFVIPYHLSGNRYGYAVSDHKEHWRPLLASWAGGHQVFELAGSTWPKPIRNPEPSPVTWGEAVLAASQLAYAHSRGRRCSRQTVSPNDREKGTGTTLLWGVLLTGRRGATCWPRPFDGGYASAGRWLTLLCSLAEP